MEKRRLGTGDPSLGGDMLFHLFMKFGTIRGAVRVEFFQEFLHGLTLMVNRQRPGLFHNRGNLDQVPAVAPTAEAERTVRENLGGIRRELKPARSNQIENFLPDGRG